MVQLLARIISLRRVLEANPGRSHDSADTLPLRHSANSFMCDYVDYPPKYGHGFAVLCSIFAASHILADSCDFFTHILLWRFAGGVGYTNYGIFPTFSLQISNKKKIDFR